MTDENVEQLQREILAALPTALLFLKRLHTAELLRDGNVVGKFDCTRDHDGGRIHIAAGGVTRTWRLLHGGFDGEAEKMRSRYGTLVEEKRSADVSVAFPLGHDETGMLYATLPTQQPTGLPLHVNADFFTASDRKGIVLEAEYQSEWNRAALHAAAAAVGENLLGLRQDLGHAALWKLVEAASKVRTDESQGQWFEVFWDEIRPRLPGGEFVYSATGQWLASNKVRWLPVQETDTQKAVLSGLGIHVVHQDLRPYKNILTSKDVVGVRALTLSELCQTLVSIGLDARVPASRRPNVLASDSDIEALWGLADMVAPQGHGGLTREIRANVAGCALALAHDGSMVPCSEAFRVDSSDTANLFLAVDETVPFLTERGTQVSLLKDVCPAFGVRAAIAALRRAGPEKLRVAWEEGRWAPDKLLGWFEGRASELKGDTELSDALAGLPIFPCSFGLKPLKQLVFPGDFKDPVGITDVVDIAQLGDRRDFLRDLGGTELTFSLYTTRHAPRALLDKNVSADKKRKLLALLASRLSELKGIAGARDALSAVPAVECDDGQWCHPSEVYFRSDVVTRVLGDGHHFAALPDSGRDAVAEVLSWLGVSDLPRDKDIVGRICELTKNPPTGASRAAIVGVFQYLGTVVAASTNAPGVVIDLRSIAWLPARNPVDKWHKPDELYAAFREFLFSTQARFLDVPYDIQAKCANLISFLRIQYDPPVGRVVDHLLCCARQGVAVNMEVYKFLSQNADDASIPQLRGEACLWLNGRYAKSDQVYWNEHPFGRFRHQLGPTLGEYKRLFDTLGVRESPEPRDAIDVVKDIAGEFAPENRHLDDDAYSVLVGCWQILSEALDGEILSPHDVREKLGKLKVIPNQPAHVLSYPDRMFFEDRAGLAAKFGNLLDRNVIPKVEGAWPAMAASGVLSLADSIVVNLVECSDPEDDPALSETIRVRRAELSRVSSAGLTGATIDLKVLDRIRCRKVRELKLQRTLAAFGRRFPAPVEDVLSHFDKGTTILFYVPRDGSVPWAPLARELAGAICPDAEPGQLASGIKEVLSAATIEEAVTALDELGFASVAAAPSVAGQQSTPTETIGEPTEPAKSDVNDAVQLLLGRGAVPPTPPPVSGEGGPYAWLRSYVSPGHGGGGRAPGTADREQRERVDVAGIRRVRQFEVDHGRDPREMPHSNEGYDIESLAPDGNIVRYIEVKSMSGHWNTPYDPPMSRPQFREAQKKRDLYWLYVVERADQDDFVIYRIQNPAARVNEFKFDDGWKAVAEPDPKENGQHGED